MASPAGRSPKGTSDTGIGKDRGALGALVRKRTAVTNRTIHDDVEELLGLGFSKSMVADLLNVSSTEVMRWQSSAVCLPEERKRAQRLLALCDLLTGRFGVADPVGWFENRLARSCVINMVEIYYNGYTNLLLDFAAGRKTAEQVLDAYDPAWREVPPSMWEVAYRPDGESFIRMRGDKDS